MTDRELLELAAKACGLEEAKMRIEFNQWNPLEDDGDALRLAVKLGISVLIYPACVGTKFPQNKLPIKLIGTDAPYEDISSGQDPLAATRRAITRAAAEIGKAMK
jgi:hypothetical protein